MFEYCACFWELVGKGPRCMNATEGGGGLLWVVVGNICCSEVLEDRLGGDVGF